MDEQKAEWKGKGLYMTLNGVREFYPAKSKEHWAALKRFAEEANKKTGGFVKHERPEKTRPWRF